MDSELKALLSALVEGQVRLAEGQGKLAEGQGKLAEGQGKLAESFRRQQTELRREMVGLARAQRRTEVSLERFGRRLDHFAGAVIRGFTQGAKRHRALES